MRADKKTPLKADKKVSARGHKRGVIGYSKKSALLEDAITQMNAGKYGRSSAALKELLALDPLNMEARRLFATLHLRLGSLLPARQAFESLANEALERQDYWLAESLLREYLAAGPRCVPFIEKLGAVYQEKGDALAASEEFGKAIDILIEDPDADRPTRPAELYAKIRELAPASPPAFRLAAHFDAQTGDLIARAATVSAPQLEEALTSTVAVKPSDPITPILSAAVSEPVSGIMPWDDVSTNSLAAPAESHQSESPEQVLSPPARFESTTEFPPASVVSSFSDELSVTHEVGIELARLESDSIPSPSIPSNDTSGFTALSISESTLVSPLAEGRQSTDNASSVSDEDVASLPTPHDSVTVSLNEAIRPVEVGLLSQSDVSIPSASSASDALHAPLPWEQVEDATVTIAPSDVEPLLASANGGEPSLAFSPEVSLFESGALEVPKEQTPAELFVTGAGETLSSATTQEFSPDVAWSAPDIAMTESVSYSSLSPEPPLTSSLNEAHQIDAPIEFVPPPMPWEQVQDSSVSIEGSDQGPITLKTVEATETTPAQSLETYSGKADEQIARDAITISSELESAGSQGANSDPTAGLLSPLENLSASSQDQKVGEFSWASIFNSAWKFGSSSPAPHDSLDHSLPSESSGLAEPGLSEDPTVVPALQDELTTVDSLSILSESMAVSASPVEPAVSPLPWEQIQEAPVTIPPADIALSTAAEPLVAPSAAPVDVSTQVVAQSTTEGILSAAVLESAVSDAFQERQSVETAQIKAVEPSFRFVDSTSITGEADSSDEAGQLEPPMPVAEKAGEAAPVSSPVPADTVTSVGFNEFRIASPAEPVVEAQETSRLDVSRSGGEAVPAAPSESASPVLPYELLPVLQTLVDQLSVVTKTIPAIAPETKSPEPASPPQEVVQPAATLREPSKTPDSVELAANPSSAQTPPAESGTPSQWKTGEVAVQTHRPSAKKSKYSTDQAPEPPSLPAEAEVGTHREPVTHFASTVDEPVVPASAPVQEKKEWIRTGEAIRFIDPRVAESAHLSPPPPVAQQGWAASEPSTAESAVDVLFKSTGSQARMQSFERTPVSTKSRPQFSAKLARVRIGLSVFVGSCFSTTRALVTSVVGLAVLCVAILAMAVGAVGLTWLVMEEKPSPGFQSLTTPPQRTMMDSTKNGYLLLLGFEANSAVDPVQAGYERKPDAKDAGMATVCQGSDESKVGGSQKNASASVAQGWYQSADPTGQFKIQADSLKGWMSQANTAISRYRQWLKMPFEDWGHGQAVAPPCAAILFAHRLHVAEGFNQGAGTEGGVERLESDMEVWRTTLGQAKTLPVKMMALQAINDDIAVASGLLVKPDFDGKALPRITKMLRPLDPVESSMCWPMQSQLVLATKSYEAQLDADRGEDVPFHVSVAGMLPLPKQRRFNGYAEYYEASYKTAGEGRYGAMPKRSTYIKHPATSFMDYLTNPIENIIGLDPLPAWDHYNGLVIDTDAHLRLASLQAWLRRGPQDADLLARIAKAGQRLYDPYTGLPMLVNLKRGVMYSVGHDGKDQDADPQQDVVVSIPLNQPAAMIAKPAPKSK